MNNLKATLVKRVFEYWFDSMPGLPYRYFIDELAFGKRLDQKYVRKWFGGEALDAEIRNKFCADLDWVSQTNELPMDENDSLARIIVLDQFSRNIHRDTPRMFSADTQALDLARFAVEKGLDRKIRHPLMRVFLYMPFMHAEDMKAQDEGLDLFKTTYDLEPNDSPFKSDLANNVEYMKKHRDIIARFGRYPHRNKILGRIPTREEEDFLANGGETFDARKVKP